MYLYFDNTIYIFNENNIDKNILFLNLKKKYPTFKEDKINSIIDLYYGITKYKCKYDPTLENQILDYVKF